MENLLQRSRYELKYLVNEACAQQVRDFARRYLVPDPHARQGEGTGYGYPIYSVYLDSPQLDLFTATIEGHKNRFKLRTRYYDETPDSPVFFEIKRRANQAILKERARVHHEAAGRLLEGASPDPSDLVNPADARAWTALQKFCKLRDKIDADGRVIVAYDREAWVTPEDNSARLTFDRDLKGATFDPVSPTWRSTPWVATPMGGGGIVMEMKFTDRLPGWMQDVVRIFDLDRCSMAKYIKCMNRLEPRRPETAERKPLVLVAEWVRPAGTPVPTPAPATRTPAPAVAPTPVPAAVLAPSVLANAALAHHAR